VQTVERVSTIPPYFFATLGQKIQALKDSGKDIIRMDMGSPDMPPANFIIESLVEEVQRPDQHGYTPFGGTPAFLSAVSEYYDHRYGVDLDPKSEIVGLIGSKEGLYHITQCYVSNGDVVLVPDPGYPIYSSAAKIAGGEVYSMPLLEENGFLPDLAAIPEEILKQAKILWLNYPNNPTGAVAERAFFQDVISLANRYDLLVCHDSPYTEVSFDGYSPMSMLEVDGAKDRVLEFNSLSKSYNMAGWRLGMAVGNPEPVNILRTLKSQIDTSHFGPILTAGITALTGDQEWLVERNRIYQERRDLVYEAFSQVGMAAALPKASLYIWAKAPADFETTVDFTDRLLAETGVSITPGIAFGENGEPFVRVSLGTPTERVSEAMNRLVTWLKQYVPSSA